MKKDKKDIIDLLKADDLGQVPDNTGSNILPKPVANKIIQEITEQNYLRKIFPKIQIPKNARNLTIPVVNFGTDVNVYKVSYGTNVTDGTSEQSFTTGSLVLTPQLLVAWLDVIEDDLETAGIDLAKFVRTALSMKLGEAEEKAMLFGVENGPSSSYASIFDGVYTVAASANAAATPITYTTTDDIVFKIADARKALGVYGSNPANLVLLCSTTFGNRLRKNDKVYNAQYGLDPDVLKRGALPPVLGIKVIESTYLDAKESGEVAILVRKDAFILGERKNIWVRQKDIEEEFKKRIIIAEEIDFKPQFKNSASKYEGLVLIHLGS